MRSFDIDERCTGIFTLEEKAIERLEIATIQTSGSLKAEQPSKYCMWDRVARTEQC